MTIVDHAGVEQICPPWISDPTIPCPSSGMWTITAPKMRTPSGITSRSYLELLFLSVSDGEVVERALWKIQGKRGAAVLLRVTDYSPGGYEGFPEEYEGYPLYKVQDWEVRKPRKPKKI